MGCKLPTMLTLNHHSVSTRNNTTLALEFFNQASVFTRIDTAPFLWVFSCEMLSISVHTVRMFCKYFFKSLEFCKFWSLSVNINNILEKITSCMLGKYWDKYWCFLVSFWWDLYLLSCDILAIYNKIHKIWFYW